MKKQHLALVFSTHLSFSCTISGVGGGGGRVLGWRDVRGVGREKDAVVFGVFLRKFRRLVFVAVCSSCVCY